MQSAAELENKKPFIDEHTDKRIHEHLSNEKDSISEEDIRNVKTGVDAEPEEDITTTGKPEIVNEGTEKPGEEIIKDNSDPEIDTSWNILES